MNTDQPTRTDPTLSVRRDLAEILEMDHQLLTQAVHDANAQIDGTSLPGGRAMIALAHAGDPATFERRVELAEQAWFTRGVTEGRVEIVDGNYVDLHPDQDRPDPADLEDEDTAPALQILRYWSERYRWALGMVWDHIPTIATEARFLRNAQVLAYVTANHASEWAHMARDVNRARRHLESILHAGRRPQRSRVVCNRPQCVDARAAERDAGTDVNQRYLIRVHGPTFVTAWECTACGTTVPETRACDRCHRAYPPGPDDTCTREVGRKDDRHPCGGTITTAVTLDHCPNLWCHTHTPATPVLASDETTDRWKCTSCKHRYTDGEYAAAYAAMLKDQGAERFVTVAEAVAMLGDQGRPEVTVRSWLKPPRRHTADRCTVCRRTYPPSEYNVCPAPVKGSLERCGGELRPVRRGNPDKVIEAYCDLATHRTYVWWPDMWRRHLGEKADAEATAARRVTSAAVAREDADGEDTVA